MDILNEGEVVLGLVNSKIIILPLVRSRPLSSSLQPFQVLKVARDTDRQFWACMNTTIKLLDARCLSDGVFFENFGEKIRAFTKLSDNIFGFGGNKRVGIADRRFNKAPLWKDDEMHVQ
jgi:hypothetical protein